MNYLAHAYFSFGDPAILTGNMISDYVKGKKQFDYPYRYKKESNYTEQLTSLPMIMLQPKPLNRFFLH